MRTLRPILLCHLCLAMLAACGGSGNSDPNSPVPPVVDISCDDPAAAEVMQLSVTSPIPQDLDELVDPLPTTEIYVTAMLPERCPGERFPLVLQSHGYGGSRRTEMAADGTLYPQDPGLTAIDEMTTALPHHNYVVISVDQRGHGESQPQNGGGYVRLNSPTEEIEDIRHILDWAYDNAQMLHILQEDGTGIDKDLRVGTLGYSYGGAMQFALAARDRRVDAMVPIATWNNLPHSLAANNAMKQSWIQTLCLFAVIPSSGAVIGAINTPAMRTMCNNAAIRDVTAFNVRTLDDLVARISADNARPRPVTREEFFSLLQASGTHRVRASQHSGDGAALRAVPTLVMQGNRDGLFNMTEGYLNWRSFRQAGADARLLTMESGHLTPIAAQIDGTGNCGGVQGVYAVLAWYEHYLKGRDDADFDALPTVCISVQASPNAPASPEVGVALNQMPVGVQRGAGALAVTAESVEVDVRLAQLGPQFVPLVTIPEDGYALAGIPTIGKLSVEPGFGATHEAIALVGVGLRRDGQTYLIDDQITGYVEGSYTTDVYLDEGDPLMLPGVGEILSEGDEIGLLFYEQQVQYSVVLSLTSLTTVLPFGAVNYIAGRPFPNITSNLLTPVVDVLSNPNPYRAVLEDVQLPVFKPGEFAGSKWTEPDLLQRMR